MIFLLPLLALLIAPSAQAADRTLDLSSGCKVYKLANKKWTPVDGASLDGTNLKPNQILRDERFTVFRTRQGTFGVNQKCVVAVGDAAPAMEPEAPRPTGKRRSAAKPAETAPVEDGRSPWSAAFSLGMNMGHTAKNQRTILGVASTNDIKYKSSMLFMGEANYRVNSYFRVAGEIALSQLQEDSQTGNEISFFDVMPQLMVSASDKITIYAGPMLGFYFLSQNAVKDRVISGNTVTVKQQTASSLLLGAALGGDYHLNRQFDIGLFFRYFKPGDLKVTGTVTAPSTGTFESTLSTSYMSFGARFMIRF